MRSVLNNNRRRLPQNTLVTSNTNQRVTLEQQIISRDDCSVTFSYTIINNSNQAITRPIALVSSLFGTVVISNNGLQPAERKTVTQVYPMSNIIVPSDDIVNSSYISYVGGERISNTVVINITGNQVGVININGMHLDPHNGGSLLVFEIHVIQPINNLSIPIPSSRLIVVYNPSYLFEARDGVIMLSNGSVLTGQNGGRYLLIVEVVPQRPYTQLTYTASGPGYYNTNLVIDIINGSLGGDLNHV